MNTPPCYVVPFPDFPFTRRSSKKATKEDTERFRQIVRRSLRTVQVTDSPVSLSVHLYTPGTKWDLDNLLKPLLDALNGILYRDDRQVVELHAFLIRGSARPRLEVEFQVLAGERGIAYKVEELKEAGVTLDQLKRVAQRRQKLDQ